MKQAPSPNFDTRQGAIDMLILHYTGRPSFEESLEWLTSPDKKVSSHYLISEAGEVTRLVAEGMRAWHAGKSFWAGETDINSASIGIELQNPGHEFGYRRFPKTQLESLAGLVRDVLSRHDISENRILGHSDVAPGRKQDPGELFPWRWLAGEGIGIWPDAPDLSAPGNETVLREKLTQFGYDPEAPLLDVVTAFQRHWQPEKVDGIADQVTWGRLKALL